MSLKSNFELMSRYNQWMNSNIYAAAKALSEEQLRQHRGAFFGSVLGTLNHLLVADTIWLKRFAQYPDQHPNGCRKQYEALQLVHELADPTSLDQIVHHRLADLRDARQRIDAAIIAWCRELEEEDLAGDLEYANTKGSVYTSNFGGLIQHFFNHQTHHRGQATTLLNQTGIDVGTTDLLALIRA